MRKHLAVFTGDAAQDILSGKKTIESRFSKTKLPPFGVVSTGDLIYIKPSGKDLIGQFRVKKVIFYDGLEGGDILAIKEQFGKEILADDSFWQDKKDCKYATLIFIGECDPYLTPPIKISKRNQRGWVVLD